MRRWDQARVALAAMAAVAGTGYASGRELVLFFAQLGWAGWVGIPFAAAVFGLLMALLCRWAGRMDSGSFAQLCQRLLGCRAGVAAGWLHGLLLALTAAVMLCGAGEVGALTLPLRFGFLWGAALALLIALILNLSGLRALPGLGLAVLAVGALFYAGLALDPRAVRVYLRSEVALALEGSVPAAILLALAYGAMNACLAASAVARFGRGARPAGVGLLCAAMLGALLGCANAAILRGGRELLGQALPTVLLSARWGVAGFWICAGFSFLCAASTLAAALGGLIDMARRGGRKRGMIALAALVVLACGTLGLAGTVGLGYPAVGWLCAALLLAAACRADSLLTGAENRC